MRTRKFAFVINWPLVCIPAPANQYRFCEFFLQSRLHSDLVQKIVFSKNKNYLEIFKLSKSCLNLFENVQTCRYLSRHVFNCPNVFKLVQKRLSLLKTVRICQWQQSYNWKSFQSCFFFNFTAFKIYSKFGSTLCYFIFL